MEEEGISMNFIFELNGFHRVLPNYLIIGAQRCGTTSLYEYLIRHPRILSSLTKEVHYFDYNFDKGQSWYRSFFPSVFSKLYKGNFITGEASPYYFFQPLAPKRIL